MLPNMADTLCTVTACLDSMVREATESWGVLGKNKKFSIVKIELLRRALNLRGAMATPFLPPILTIMHGC